MNRKESQELQRAGPPRAPGKQPRGQIRSFADAQQRYKHAMILFDNVQDRYNQARCTLDYAHLLRMHEKEHEAQAVARLALVIYQERGTSAQIAQVQTWIENE